MTDPNVYAPEALASYDLVMEALGTGPALAAWVSQEADLQGARVLDLGAGTGASSLALADAGAEVVAVDASPEALELLAQRRENRTITTVADDFRTVRLSNRFDAVVMSRNTFFSATEIDDKIALLQTIGHHLAPGGRAYLSCTDPAEFLRHGGDAHTVTLPLGHHRAVTLTQTADRVTQSVLTIYIVTGASEHVAFHEQATWATLAEIRLLARLAGLEVAKVAGSHDGGAYQSSSREMLVTLTGAA